MMQGLPWVSGEFTLGEDPQLRFTPSGAAVANVRMVATGRRFNKDSNEWEDGAECWLTGSVWQTRAENVAESLRKGDRVTVTGYLETRSYETREGEKRSVTELRIESIGPALRFRAVLHTDAQGRKVTREGAQSAPADNDPWATPAGGSDEPPF